MDLVKYIFASILHGNRIYLNSKGLSALEWKLRGHRVDLTETIITYDRLVL